MKKGLFSILATAALLVGCQNYDDQFDALNSQITALQTEVAGLAGVQSDVAALKGLISSLQGAVDGVNSSLSSQLEEALADIEAVEAAVADVASGEDLAAVQADLAAVDENVDTLLESDAFFNGDLTINSAATLTFAQQLGQKVKVINGTLTISGWDDMDSEAVNAITAQMLTVTEDVKVRMKSQSQAAITFPELGSVRDLWVAQAGSYSFPKLVSAGSIYLGENYSSKVTIVDFRALTTITNFYTSTIATNFATSSTETDTIDFDEAEEIHLTALGYYVPKTLTIVAEDNATVALDNFTSQDSEGVVRTVTLKVTGADSVVLPNYKNGSFTATDVETVELANFYGSVTISGVENLTVGALDTPITMSDSSTLTNLTITAVANGDPDVTTDKEGVEMSMKDQTNLETVVLKGLYTKIDFTGCSNLFDLTMTEVTANELILKDNGDLSDVAIDGAINKVTLDNADDLTEVSFGHTTALGKPNGQTTALTAGEMIVTGNNKLQSLVVTKADKINKLTITGNAKLEVIDFQALKSVGGSTDKATVAIGGTATADANKLNATKITDKLDGSSSTDLGSIESATKLESLKVYLGAAALAPKSVKVYFDSADLHVTEVDGGTDTEINNLKMATHASKLTVMDVTETVVNSAKYATDTFVGDIEVKQDHFVGDANKYVAGTAYANGSTIEINYPNIANKSWSLSSANTTDTTMDAMFTRINTEADADNFDITIESTSKKAHYFVGTFVAGGGQESVSATGSFLFDLGSVTGITGHITAGDDLHDLNGSIVAAANAAQASWSLSIVTTASLTSVTNVIKVVPELTTTVIDNSPKIKWALPTTLAVSFLSGTVSWSAAGTNSNYGSSFTLSWAAKAVNTGFTIIAKNQSTILDQSVSIASNDGIFTGTVSKLAAGSFYNDGNIDGKASTTVDSEIGGYVRAFADATAGSTNTGNSNNKSSWL